MPVTAAAQSASGPQPPTPSASLAAFDALVPGDQAPGWLRDGVAASWQFGSAAGGDVAMRLITVSENATFLVTADGDPVAVVRVARPGYLAGADAFESEVAWVAALAADGVCQVPAALRTGSGTFCAALADEAGTDWWCVAYGYVTGRILEDLFSDSAAGAGAADPTSYYREIGAINARLHEHALTWAPPAGFARHSWDVPDMLGPTARWGRWEDAVDGAERSLLEEAQAAALATVGRAPRDAAAWGLVHADLRPSNIMIQGESLTVIDFDDCGHTWFQYDFAAALSFLEHTPEAPTMALEWLAGYTSVRPLARDAVELGCALSMVRRLQMLGWTTTHRADALPPDLWSAQVPGTLAVAESYLRNPTWLLD
ncbi:phosphotransferase enzyme family protein [Promicromonospora soli]|uniref:Aminoglycoside phosphotransferase n=1 Tax=Promicromonospora soli TaxID=2035533 RepID=A0A919G8E8_9MICO|nr:phosphotransferase [Promicromonospora soli]GHH79699.1 aminoglycoside phosphotransferase [Promicromonospora soli]